MVIFLSLIFLTIVAIPAFCIWLAWRYDAEDGNGGIMKPGQRW